MSDPTEFAASVVIPAHDEERVIGRCLESLAASTERPLQVVVAANGCSDRTVEVARSYADRLPGLVVLDLATPGKANALNEGDAAATAFPRLFLDADIVLDPGALDQLVDALSTDAPRAASPHVRFVTSDSDPVVRAYYTCFRELPYVKEGLVGLGIYGLSQAGRARFDRFPDLNADDLFIQRLFEPSERIIVPGTFAVQAPRTAADLLKVRVRIAKGNAEVARVAAAGELPGSDAHDFTASTGSTVSALGGLVRRRPTLVPAAIAYLGVTVAARLKARRADTTTWERDASTR